MPLLARLRPLLHRARSFRPAFDFAFDPRSLVLQRSIAGADCTYTGRTTSPVALARYAQRLQQRAAAASASAPSTGMSRAEDNALARNNESKSPISDRAPFPAAHAKMEGGGLAG